MINKTSKYIISSNFVKVFVGKEQFTFKEKDNINSVKKLIKTEVLKTLANSMKDEAYYKYIKSETNLKRMVKYIRKTSVVNEDLFIEFVNAINLTSKAKPRETALILIAKYIKNDDKELECDVIEEYIKLLAKKELLIENYIDSEGAEDEDDDGHGFELDEPMVEDEEETKPVKKHSTKMTKDKNISIDGEELKADKTLVKKHVMKCITKGVTKKAYHKFLSKVKENPRKYVEEELYAFLESGNFPIADDGDFYAFKKITSDYKDDRTGTMDNRPGKYVKMNRKDVCDDRTQTCSAGLHFAAMEYARTYSGTKLVILKINPEDVVSIPNDYDNQKGRCCRYKVICELTDSNILDNMTNREFLRKIQEIETKNDKIIKNKKNAGEKDFIKF